MKQFLLILLISINICLNAVFGENVESDSILDTVTTPVAPELDVDATIGYFGKIGEKHVLVDITPHLQVKNFDQINGICSYHVYKPSDEDFPFIVDIKDKDSGEAVIQLGINESNGQLNQIDCTKRRFYKFFIEAHDCTEPVSVASSRVPVTIEIIDHNDSKLKFENDTYNHKIVENTIDISPLIVKAKDNDCTNDGFACHYEIINAEIPFNINNLGFISNTIPLKKSDKIYYDFVVRAYDCADNSSFVDANVHIEVVEPCRPEWKNFNSLINSSSLETQIFPVDMTIKECNDGQTICDLAGYESTVELDFNNFPSGCEFEKCNDVENDKKFKFLSNTDGDKGKIPTVFETFNRKSERAIKSSFDGNFGSSFKLNVWVRRPYEINESDLNEKEHVLCGSDSELLNRHHYGFYFFNKKVKFLLRKEHNNENDKDTTASGEFYPSLWEWSIDSIEGDAKWHFYEIKYEYPNAQLFIDGIKFEENQTNSDIIDAYELENIAATGLRVTYIGACYNARSRSFTNFFNGDVSGLSLERQTVQKRQTNELQANSIIECVKNCKEYLDLNMIGNENYLKSIELTQYNTIKLNTQTLYDMILLLNKINYINKNLAVGDGSTLKQTQIGKRFVKLNTNIKCYKSIKPNGNIKSSSDDDIFKIHVNELSLSIDVKKPKQEFNVNIDGNKQYLVNKNTILNNGILLFKDVKINKISINKLDYSQVVNGEVNLNANDDLDDDSVDDDDIILNEDDSSKIYFSSCSIRILPVNINEKFVVTSFNTGDDDYNVNSDDLSNTIGNIENNFKITKNSDLFVIDGLNTIESYENYLRNLIYIVDSTNTGSGNNMANSNNIDEDGNKLNLYKQFYLSCIRNEPSIETNTVLVQVNITDDKDYVAFKQRNKFTGDDSVIEDKIITNGNNNALKPSSPVIVIVIVMFAGLMGFLIVFTIVRMKNRRRGGANEENPQMEWDDSGLNITENPLEELEANEEDQRNNYEDEYSSTEDSEEYNSEQEEEPEKIVDRELEWDDSIHSLEINENRVNRVRSNLEYIRNTTNA